MANTSLQMVDVPFQLSFDNGSTWKDVICTTNYSVPLTKTVTNNDTSCGQRPGYGRINFNPTATGICETIPDAGQCSSDDLMQAMQANTALIFRVQNGTSGSTGIGLFIKGSCRVTALNIQAAISDVIKFDFTLTGEGAIDTVTP